MSTPATIALWEDSTLTTTTVHFDGYPSYTGTMLLDHYNTLERVRELIALGDLSAIRPRLSPREGVKHTFTNPDPETTIAYHRDRLEDWEHTRPKEHIAIGTETECVATLKCIGEQYAYVFRDDTWYTLHLNHLVRLADI